MNITFDFSGKGVLVTGAAQGIGFEIAKLFADAGALVTAIDRNESALAQAWAGIERVTCAAADVADADGMQAVVDAALERVGRVDVAVNNAGITRDSVVWKLTSEAWHAVLDVHLTGTFNMTRAVVPPMRAAKFGRIINVTSYTGMHGNIGQANYAAAKAGIIGFTKTVAKETARFGITVNAVSPNAMTAMVEGVPPEKLTELTALVPLGRFGAASEMAPMVAFLASEEAGYITGAVLPIDGGLSM
ncbi:MAG: SDR family NAD(P)-dependent oxidoreductase [Acidimicrobiales bacterium]